MKSKSIDKTFLLCTILLVTAGFFIFSSASMGLLAREGISYSSVAIKQFVVGFVVGGISLLVFARIPYKFWRQYAFYIFLATIIACICVFLPKIGFEHGGAKRWINLGAFTVQPGEFLKIGAVIYFAAWISSVKDRIKTFKYGALPLFIILGITGLLIMKQPDTGTYMVIFASMLAMFISAGGKWRYVGVLIASAVAGVGILALMRPYLMGRILTFLDPSRDALGQGYQIQQSLIAIGSGGIFGRGFGQSIQKFNFLPEPIGDSIFAVAGEEFGFIGGILLISLFLIFAMRGYKIASRIPDSFGMNLVVGLVTIIIAQAFINMAAMLGVIPLTGIPLSFVSHGGTAMLMAMAAVGIILNISKTQRT
ncbi:MAG: putative lipid II flippase FtsW [bacterium]|nr:putative lipid II flippase FtsW [bacterium]